jgi:hypothetical protein
VVAVLDAFSHLAARHPELSLVLHGPNGWLGDEVGEGLQHRGLHGRRSSARARFPAASSPPSTPGRRCSSTRRSTRGSGCRSWRRWPAAPRS